MLPCTQKLSELKFTPKGIILSGGPYSVYEEGSPHVDPAVFDLSKHAPPPARRCLTDCLIFRRANPGHLLCVMAPVLSTPPITLYYAADSFGTTRRHAGARLSPQP